MRAQKHSTILITALAFTACSPTSDAPKVDNHPAAAQALVRGGPGSPRRRNFIGIYRPSTARFVLKMNRPGWDEPAVADQIIWFGNPYDTPLVGDWDGDGVETLGVWRAGTFFLANTLGGGANLTFSFQQSTDKPIVGDWDGNGTATIGVFRNGTFLLRNSNSAGAVDVTLTFGAAGDIPLVGDWDGDGVETVGVYRPSTLEFLLINKNESGRPVDVIATINVPAPWVNSSEKLPVVGDWNEDGLTSIGIKSESAFFLKNGSTANFLSYVDPGNFQHTLRSGDEVFAPLGATGDIPISGNWVPSASTGTNTIPAELVGRFPIGVWLQLPDSFDTWKGRGINTMVYDSVVAKDPETTYAARKAADLDAYTTAARAKGLWLIREPILRNGVFDAETNVPELLAWHLGDEPDTSGNDKRNQFVGTYQTLKGRNASRAIMFNLVGEYILSTQEGPCNGPGDFPAAPNLDCYPGYLGAEDWVAEDWYPLSHQFSMQTTGRILDKLTRWSKTKPLFPFIETNPIFGPNSSGATPLITANMFRSQVWLAIVHGARGILYFAHGPCDPCQSSNNIAGSPSRPLNPPNPEMDVWQEMLTTNTLITTLSPSLQATINPPSMGMRAQLPPEAKAQLEIGWRQSGTSRLFIVVNPTPFVLGDVTFTVSGFTPATRFVRMDDNVQVGQAGSKTFTDNFGAYGTHIYKVQ